MIESQTIFMSSAWFLLFQNILFFQKKISLSYYFSTPGRKLNNSVWISKRVIGLCLRCLVSAWLIVLSAVVLLSQQFPHERNVLSPQSVPETLFSETPDERSEASSSRVICSSFDVFIPSSLSSWAWVSFTKRDEYFQSMLWLKKKVYMIDSTIFKM